MRRKLCKYVIILIFMHSLVFPLFSLAFAKPELPVRNIDTGLEYTTIQAAINAAETLDGHTILVNAGTYYENVIVNKSISLTGHDKFDTIIHGQLQQNVVTGIADSVKIAGFTVEESAYGYGGIHLYTSERCNITDNIVENCYYGLNLYNSSDNLIYDNLISECEYGVRLYNSSKNIISENAISKSKNGIQFDISDNNMAFRNNVSLNLWSATYFFQSSNNTISDNILSFNGIYGTRLNNSTKNTFSNNNVSENQQGFNLYESANNSLFSNAVSGNADGIWLMSSSQNAISANTVNNNSQYGLRLLNSSYNTVFHNNFVNNTLKNVEQPSNTSFSNLWDNFLEGNYWSDQEGKDSDKDGIIELPHIVDQRTWLGLYSQDNYPLMGQFQHLSLQFQNKSYSIEIITNSTITEFSSNFDKQDDGTTLTLKSTSHQNSSFCRISLPHILVKPPYNITINDKPPIYHDTIRTNGTHTWIYFEYSDSEQEATITLTHEPTPIAQMPIWTQWPFWETLGLATLAFVLSLINVKSRRTISKQKKLMRTYEEKLQKADPLIIARELLTADVQSRKAKITKFEQKYGLKIQPRNSLEDIIKSIRSRQKENKKTKGQS